MTLSMAWRHSSIGIVEALSALRSSGNLCRAAVFEERQERKWLIRIPTITFGANCAPYSGS
jgi:hypothetical protein